MPALIPFIGQCAHAKTAWKSANGMAVRITSSQTGCIAQRSRPGWKGRARTACGGASATISRTSASGRPGPHRRGPATRRPGRPSGERGDGRRCGAGEQRRKHALQLGRQLGVAVVRDDHGRHHRAARSLRQAVQSMPSPRAPRRPDSAPTRSAGRVARARGPGAGLSAGRWRRPRRRSVPAPIRLRDDRGSPRASSARRPWPASGCRCPAVQ